MTDLGKRIGFHIDNVPARHGATGHETVAGSAYTFGKRLETQTAVNKPWHVVKGRHIEFVSKCCGIEIALNEAGAVDDVSGVERGRPGAAQIQDPRRIMTMELAPIGQTVRQPVGRIDFTHAAIQRGEVIKTSLRFGFDGKNDKCFMGFEEAHG